MNNQTLTATTKRVVIEGTPYARDAEDTYYVQLRDVDGTNALYQFGVHASDAEVEDVKHSNRLHKALTRFFGEARPYGWVCHKKPLEIEVHEVEGGWYLPKFKVTAYRLPAMYID
ncbi:MAG: hypothetical protein ACI4UF_03835 [Thermoguttaceae bacterium]